MPEKRDLGKMASTTTTEAFLENGNIKLLSKEMRHGSRTAHNMSSSSLRKKSDKALVSKIRVGFLRMFFANLQEVLLGTKLAVLFLAIPFAIVAKYRDFGSVSALFCLLLLRSFTELGFSFWSEC